MAYLNPDDARAYKTKWLARNPEKRRAYERQWREANPEKYRAQKKRMHEKRRDKARIEAGLYHLKKNYGLTPETRGALFAQQGSRCAVCRTDNPPGNKGWHIDHCHSTGKVRGILCRHCNVALGHVSDDPDRLRALARYIEHHRREVIAV